MVVVEGFADKWWWKVEDEKMERGRSDQLDFNCGGRAGASGELHATNASRQVPRLVNKRIRFRSRASLAANELNM